MNRLLMIIPTRGRPHSMSRLFKAWTDTDAWTAADMLLAVDSDDPTLPGYRAYVDAAQAEGHPVVLKECGAWQPMVPKLNAVAAHHAPGHTALGFAGDDHVPRTHGWASTYLDRTTDQPRIVYGDDTHWNGTLATEWAMSSVIVQALNRMVPADVAHLYCDNAVMDIGRETGTLLYLPTVTIEHMHYSTGKAHLDAQYARVNAPRQYRRDRQAYVHWRDNVLPAQAAHLRATLTALNAPRPPAGSPGAAAGSQDHQPPGGA